MNDHCIRCQAPLTSDEIGLFKKLIDRTAEENFCCKKCIAEEYRCSVELLDRKIEQFKENGCLLFVD